jgi:hypothetical protein
VAKRTLSGGFVMADWKSTLDMSDVFYKLNPKELADIVAERMDFLAEKTGDTGFPLFNVTEIQELVDFAEAFRTTVETTESFDTLWEEFYNWADHKKRVWVKLF